MHDGPCMTFTELDVPFADVSAARLRWALGLEAQPALAVRSVRVGHVRLDLRVLGASHQVMVRREGSSMLSETVACGLPGAAGLPDHLESDGYRFTSHVELLDADDLRRRIRGLGDDLAGQPGAIVAAFPGDAHAVTAIAVDARLPLGWRTWHAYPQTGELVTTDTRLSAKETPWAPA